MDKKKKIIIGVIIILLIIVIGIVVTYKLIENGVIKRENFNTNNTSPTSITTEGLIYEETVSPNGNYVNSLKEEIFYTIKVYKKEKSIVVKASSSIAGNKDLQYEINNTKKLTKDNIKVEWTTLRGDTNFSEENQIGIGVVTLSYNNKIFSKRKINFVNNTIDIIDK